MVLRYLRELVGEYRQPIIIDGELLTIDTAIIYCRKNRGVITFLTINSKKEEIIYQASEVLELIQQKINIALSKHPLLTPNSDINNQFKISCCKLTNIIVIKTIYYQLMEDEKGHMIKNKLLEYESALTDFYIDELINYYLLYTRVLRPRISRRVNILIRAHLINNYFIPIKIASRDINCPFDYIDIAKYIEPLLHYEKVLSASDKTQSGLKLSVLAGCDFAEVCNIAVKPLEPNYIMFGIIYKCLTNFGESAMKRFLQTYQSVVAAIDINKDDTVTQIKINRYECFAALLNTPFT